MCIKIPSDDPVRIFIKVLEGVNLRKYLPNKTGRGRNGYDPYMMLKVVLFTYTNGIYSCTNLWFDYRGIIITIGRTWFEDNKPHNISARLIAKDEDLIIRIRDNCEPFNLTEYYEIVQGEQKQDKEISLTIIMKTAKDVSYAAAFGTNNIIVRI